MKNKPKPAMLKLVIASGLCLAALAFAVLQVIGSTSRNIPDMQEDVFQSQGAGPHPWLWSSTYAYGAMPIDEESRWALASNGPDLNRDSIWENPETGFNYVRYDPTNGTISNGDIWRVSDHQME